MRYLDLLLELISDKPASQITSDIAIHAWENIPNIPSNRNSGKLATLKTLSEKMDTDPVVFPRWSIKTQEDHWNAFVGLVDYAKKKHYITEDIIGTLSIAETKREANESKYQHFTDAELQRIFSGSVYSHEKKSRTAGHDYHFWLPLLAAYTGARLNELCQLFVSDIKCSDEGIWYIDINDEEENIVGPKKRAKRGTQANDAADSVETINLKSVKSEAAKRLVPIHSQLIALGFLDFVDSMKARYGQNSAGPGESPKPNRPMLFSTGLSNLGKGKWGKNASRWFNGDRNSKSYKQECGFSTKSGKVFHSFRKSFATKLINKIRVEQLAALIGHEQEYQTTFIYVGQFELATLKECIEQLQYNVKLSHVDFSVFRSKYG